MVVPAGYEPTVHEAEQRLAALRTDGPTAYAFTLADPFPVPGHSGPARVGVAVEKVKADD